jgi:hypothetical protein
MAIGFEPGAMISGAPVLPNDGPMDGFAVGAIPQQCGLALIGDADPGNIARCHSRFPHCAAAGRDCRCPQIVRLVLDLAVGREMLRKFLLCDCGNRGVGTKQDRPRRRRTLINGQDIGSQAFSPCRRGLKIVMALLAPLSDAEG